MRLALAASALFLLLPLGATSAPTGCPKDVRHAISYMTEARVIHQNWLRDIRAGEIDEVEERIGGGTRHHRRWVYIYHFTERVLYRSC